MTPQLATKRVETVVAQTAAAILSLDTPLKFVICNMTFLTIILTSYSDNLSFKGISSDLCC